MLTDVLHEQFTRNIRPVFGEALSPYSILRRQIPVEYLPMRVSVFGLGYVGCVTAACLAELGHAVVGVEVDPLKVDCINRGTSPFYETGLADIISKNVNVGRLKATLDDAAALEESDVALICVGTPSNSDGSVNLDNLLSVFHSIGAHLRERNSYLVVALRSTVLPHLVESELIPLLEKSSGKQIGENFGFVCNPEFLREGSAIEDFYETPLTLIGENDPKAGYVIAALYKSLTGPLVRTDLRTAFLAKYASNAFHALKVVFANEMGTLARELSVDGQELMEIICQDTKLNISSRYLKPGFAFGGSCLPKDLRALMTESQRRNLKLPVLDSILPSNELHLRRCMWVLTELGKKKVGLVGLAFKAGTDDLRESAAVEFAEMLLGKGYDLKIIEPCISPGSIHGSNLRFVEKSIPHIWKLLEIDFEKVVRESEVLVLMAPLEPQMRAALRLFRSDQVCLDFVGTVKPEDLPAGKYRGFASESLEAKPKVAPAV
jgi:GDP-mannose 6-dehydrogenase